jgi:hypothetical protein
MQIKNKLYQRQGAAITNFDRRLASPQAGLAVEVLKDPYHFDFLAQMKASDDKPTIGLLLCKTKKRLVAEYALSGMDKPMGVAEYQLVRALPEPLDTCLPTIEELETELSHELEEEIQP